MSTVDPSGIANNIESRDKSLSAILKKKGVKEQSLVQAIVALSEGTNQNLICCVAANSYRVRA